MLIISRKKGESILIGDDIEITAVKIEDGTVKLAISAPREVRILRSELYKEISEENKNSTCIDLDALLNVKK